MSQQVFSIVRQNEAFLWNCKHGQPPDVHINFKENGDFLRALTFYEKNCTSVKKLMLKWLKNYRHWEGSKEISIQILRIIYNVHCELKLWLTAIGRLPTQQQQLLLLLNRGWPKAAAYLWPLIFSVDLVFTSLAGEVHCPLSRWTDSGLEC